MLITITLKPVFPPTTQWPEDETTFQIETDDIKPTSLDEREWLAKHRWTTRNIHAALEREGIKSSGFDVWTFRNEESSSPMRLEWRRDQWAAWGLYPEGYGVEERTWHDVLILDIYRQRWTMVAVEPTSTLMIGHIGYSFQQERA